MSEPPVLHPFFQVGLLVADLDAARAELTAALGIEWSDTLARGFDRWPIRVCFSMQGPPYLELIEGPAGSPWEATGGSRIDHVGYWSRDLDRDKRRLDGAGVALEYDSTPDGGFITYHRGRMSGLRVELLDATGEPDFYRRWGLEEPEQPVSAQTWRTP